MNKIKKILSLMLIAVMALSIFSACGKEKEVIEETSETTESTTSEERAVKTRVAALDGPTGIGMTKVKTDRAYGYEVTFYQDPQAIVPLLVNGETDIAALPINLAANLYKKTNGGIKMLAINTLGVLHIIENGTNISSIKSLKGKTIYASGQGATPEYIFNYILKKNGLTPGKDVTIEFKSTHAEVATLAMEGKAEICLLPEPFVSKIISTDKGFRKAIDLTEEWEKVSETQLAMGCVVARTEYIEANPEIIDEFMTFNEVSINFLNTNSFAGEYLKQIGYFEDAEVAQSTIAGCNMVFIEGQDMVKIASENFEVLFNADPASVGGELPDDQIYYTK